MLSTNVGDKANKSYKHCAILDTINYQHDLYSQKSHNADHQICVLIRKQINDICSVSQDSHTSNA